jgi:hypothetical protein
MPDVSRQYNGIIFKSRYGRGAAVEVLFLIARCRGYDGVVIIPGRWLLRRVRKIVKSDY